MGYILQGHMGIQSTGSGILGYNCAHAGSGRTLRVCYLRHAYGLGEHYNSVRPGVVVVSDESGEEDAGEPAAAAADGSS